MESTNRRPGISLAETKQAEIYRRSTSAGYQEAMLEMVERGRDAAGRIGATTSEHNDESNQSQTTDQTSATSAFATEAHRQSALTAATSHAAEDQAWVDDISQFNAQRLDSQSAD